MLNLGQQAIALVSQASASAIWVGSFANPCINLENSIILHFVSYLFLSWLALTAFFTFSKRPAVLTVSLLRASVFALPLVLHRYAGPIQVIEAPRVEEVQAEVPSKRVEKVEEVKLKVASKKGKKLQKQPPSASKRAHAGLRSHPPKAGQSYLSSPHLWRAYMVVVHVVLVGGAAILILHYVKK